MPDTLTAPATDRVNRVPITDDVLNVRDFNDGRYDWDHHFTLTTNPYVRDLMINEVMSAVDALTARIKSLEAELAATRDPQTELLEEVVIRPKKSEVQVRYLALLWRPLYTDRQGA
jgi:hypothetical protein